MLQLADRLKQRFENEADFALIHTYLGRLPVTLAGYKTLIDIPETMKILSFTAMQISKADEVPVVDLLKGLGKVAEINNDEQKAAELILNGGLVMIHEFTGTCIGLVSVVPASLTRPVSTPYTENILRGSITAFNEDIDTNIGIMRKNLVNAALQSKIYILGRQNTTKLGLLYLENTVNANFLKKLQNHIENHLQAEICNIQELSVMLGYPAHTLFTRFNSSEMPQEAVSALKKGKVILFMDRFPFAIIMPSLLSDMYDLQDDTNFPYSFMIFLRLLRITGILITLLMPGLYVALVSVNPEVLRIELALSVAKSRIDVPYPAFVETFLLLIVLELILEASIRLPRTIGPTVTMVGGIILGEAVVSAKLVSNLLIIILAATTIASSTVAGYQNTVSLRLLKYLVLVLCSIYGILGLVSGIVIIAAYIASIETFGVPYFQFGRSKDDQYG